MVRDVRLLSDVQQRLSEIKAAMASASDDDRNLGVLADTWNTLLELRDAVIRLIVINPELTFAGGADALKKGLLQAADKVTNSPKL